MTSSPASLGRARRCTACGAAVLERGGFAYEDRQPDTLHHCQPKRYRTASEDAELRRLIRLQQMDALADRTPGLALNTGGGGSSIGCVASIDALPPDVAYSSFRAVHFDRDEDAWPYLAARGRNRRGARA